MSLGDKLVGGFHAHITGYSLPTEQKSSPNHIIKGKLVYNDDKLPAAGVKLNCFVPGWLGNYHVGTFTTTKRGDFTLKFHWNRGIFTLRERLIIQVVEEKLPFAEKGLPKFCEKAVIQQFTVPMSSNLGTLKIVAEDSTKDMTVIPTPLRSHTQSPAFFWKFFNAAITEVPKRLFVGLFQKLLSTSQVQWIYDLGPKFQKRPQTAENLIEELLNHVTAVGASVQNNMVVWEANWDGLDMRQKNTLPNVRVEAVKQPDGTLSLDAIHIKFRNDDFVYHVRPQDSVFKWGLYVARSVFALKGEAEFHLAEGHILPGIVAEEFFKYLRPTNPLYKALEPHLAQIDTINKIGSQGIIFGKGSVLALSALTVDSVAQVIINGVKAKANWKDYAPQEPLANNHYLAKAEKLHFEILHTFFRNYIKKYEAQIKKDWEAIYNWSKANEGHLKEIAPVTTRKRAPRQEDFDNLAKFSAWLVSKTTFLHWAAHSRQALLTDIRQASLAPQEMAFGEGIRLAPYGNTQVADANVQLFVARVLLNFKGDALLTNPYGDVNADLIEAIKTHLANYEGYSDIEKMFITTQI